MHASKSSIHPKTPEIVLKSIFQRYDVDEDAYLNVSEFTKALEDLGIMDQTEQKALFALADADNNKRIQYNDFSKLIKSNDFECILSSREDYQFVIETYHAFQQYDHNDDGEVTWSEFYFYLTQHGYSHETISQYWYYMDQEKKLTISFEGFWKGYKLQHESTKTHELQKRINQQITNKQKCKKKKYNKTFNRPSFIHLVTNNSWNQSDPNNIFHYAKRHLSPSKHKQNKSPFATKKGRVLAANDSESKTDLELKCDMSEVSSLSYISQSRCNTFNFVDYNMDDIDAVSDCSSVSSPTLSQSQCSLQLMESNSFTVTLSDSIAMVHGHVLDIVDEIDPNVNDYRDTNKKRYSETLNMDFQSQMFVNKNKSKHKVYHSVNSFLK